MEDWASPAELARQFAPAVYRLAYARTGSRADAEDVMQEVFLRLIRTDPAFQDREHAKAWLLRVAANCVNDLFRSPWRKRTAALDETVPAPQMPESGGVLEAVLDLPAKYRIPIHLYYYEEMSVSDIAAALGKKESTVKTWLHRGRALLRQWLGEEDECHVER